MWKRPERPWATDADHIRRALIRELRSRQTPRPEDPAPDDSHQWAISGAVDVDGRPIPTWASSAFPVDDVSHPAEMFAAGDDWVEVVDLDGAIVGLQSHGIPPHAISLTRITDIAPHVEGSRQSRDRGLNRRR